MNTSVNLLVTLCVAGAFCTASAQRPPDPGRFIPVIAALDADGDGTVSEAEINAAPAALGSLDKDGSETLTAEELVPRFGGRPEPAGGEPGPRQARRGMPADMLRRIPATAALDADGDGEISAPEIRDSAASLRALDRDRNGSLDWTEMLPEFGGRGGRGPGFRFEQAPLPVMTAIDRDGNGEISPEEIASASAALRSLDADADGSLVAGEAMPPPPEPQAGGGRPGPPGGAWRVPPLFEALDVDRSSDLDPKEIEAASDSLAKLDRDGSGVITPDELRGGRGPGGRGPGGPGGFPGGPGFEGRGGPRGSRGGAAEPRLPGELDPSDGGATIPDRETFERFSYQGSEVLIDTGLIGLEFVKFIVMDAGGAKPVLYFMNTETHRAHPPFMRVMGLEERRGRGGSVTMRGVIVYRPRLTSPSGEPGLYTYEFEPRDAYPFELIRVAHDMLGKHSPLMAGNLAYLPLPAAVPQYRSDREKYEAAGLPVILQDQMHADLAYLPLHVSEGFGMLRRMSVEERPRERDIVLYETLPNEMPRVAGIITAVRQTPLSHVNLRAVQDDVPNAFIRRAAEDPGITGLVGKYVYYRVAEDSYEIREASVAEVEKHFEKLRPSEEVALPRDLEARRILPLDEVGFADHSSIGVKAANVAALGRLGLPDGVVPEGFAVPFRFYDEFMRHNGFYDAVEAIIGDPEFQADTSRRVQALKDLRRTVKDGEMPAWMLADLEALQDQFPEGQPIRLRSSTNNEDLPGFSGAGLYDSFTHHPDEGHIAKSVKQVFASLWNFRAFEEREFFRIDHSTAAMGVLVHPNYSGELANGVAVTEDVAYQTGDYGRPRMYYVNTQVGEDLVTNPEEDSVPEEILLSTRGPQEDQVVRASNRAQGESGILSEDHRDELREYLRRIHNKFKVLYDVDLSDRFAMEIEFKVTAEGRLAVKQARPWVFN